MLTSIFRRIAYAGLGLVDLLHLRPVLRWIYSRLPHSAKSWLGLLQVRLGLMEGMVKVPEARLQESLEAAIRLVGPDRTGIDSAYLEFGVYVGTSMACMYHATEATGARSLRLIGFDSFQGMPDDEPQDVWTWKPGQLYSDVRLTRANMRRLGVRNGRVELVKGWYEDSLKDATKAKLGIERASIIMVDCVLESSTRLALDFCTSLIQDEAVIFFDDWRAGGLDELGLGERKAFEAWLADHPEMIATPRPDLGYEKDSEAFIVARRTTADGTMEPVAASQPAPSEPSMDQAATG